MKTSTEVGGRHPTPQQDLPALDLNALDQRAEKEVMKEDPQEEAQVPPTNQDMTTALQAEMKKR